MSGLRRINAYPQDGDGPVRRLGGRAMLGDGDDGVSKFFAYPQDADGPVRRLMFRGQLPCGAGGIVKGFPCPAPGSNMPVRRLMARAAGCAGGIGTCSGPSSVTIAMAGVSGSLVYTDDTPHLEGVYTFDLNCPVIQSLVTADWNVPCVGYEQSPRSYWMINRRGPGDCYAYWDNPDRVCGGSIALTGDAYPPDARACLEMSMGVALFLYSGSGPEEEIVWELQVTGGIAVPWAPGWWSARFGHYRAYTGESIPPGEDYVLDPRGETFGYVAGTCNFEGQDGWSGWQVFTTCSPTVS